MSHTAAAPPLDYVGALDRIIDHVLANAPVFAHISPRVLLTGFSQARVGGEYGIYATIQGLRFAGGASTEVRGKRTYRWPRVVYEDREILYLVLFMMPRFADLPFRGKMTTIFHELYHVSPRCDGDLRRFPGRNYAHGHSREAYNARLQPWIDDYLRRPGAEQATALLHLGFEDLRKQHGAILGRRLQPVRPQLVK